MSAARTPPEDDIDNKSTTSMNSNILGDGISAAGYKEKIKENTKGFSKVHTARIRKLGVDIELKKKAIQVLYEKMDYYDNKAKRLIVEALKLVQAASPPKAELAALLIKKFRECDDIVIECAKYLAPYQSPRLESIEHKGEIEHKYVIQAPRAIKNTSDWLASTSTKLIDRHNAIEIDADSDRP